MSYAARTRSALLNAGPETAHAMTNHLQSTAKTMGWPDHAVKTLRVEHDGMTFHTKYDKDVVHEWEFGTETRPAKPAIRQFATRHYAANTHLSEALSKHWGEL